MGKGKASVISGSQHFIISKKIVWMSIMVGLGTFLGMYLSEHLRAKQTESFLKHKNDGVKNANEKLKKEKEEYSSTFASLNEHLEEWKKGRDMTIAEQALHVTNFQERAQSLIEGLSDMQTLLEEKEFQLWEKEGLLEYQEERLMNSEDLELEMANYINDMAQTLIKANMTLPTGLDEKPYYGSQLGSVDDDPAAGEYLEEGGDTEEEIARRRLSYSAQSRNGVTGGLRAFMLETREQN
mmetsp:Transcript_26962/g.72391  ORF Transcript_26962/g.72391 Transcript_26962/m.72391 type:complete len:239 (-) Transcript_26962:1181-1897(-)|eukprot:CAMPEP_0119473364 /NCGR_PEP_ID=MMETSP1344-20130328/5051_1 /TAXON_ID=236787 /ORGANISM="Florenciella parvula, Strain CCMP2471" /LENGTH=238 /DNA_ID=CAMNT_0007506467 /DNA_START=272 /DNA_END=988 /DNA_ORIENTATION=+